MQSMCFERCCRGWVGCTHAGSFVSHPYSCSDVDDLSLLELWCLGLANGVVGWLLASGLVLGLVCEYQAVKGMYDMTIDEAMSYNSSVRNGAKRSSAT
jgi:hypothetical protein